MCPETYVERKPERKVKGKRYKTKTMKQWQRNQTAATKLLLLKAEGHTLHFQRSLDKWVPFVSCSYTYTSETIRAFETNSMQT